MKQVLFVCAGKEFPKGAFNFLLSMQQDAPVEALGLFFSPIDLEAMVTVTQFPVQGPFYRLEEEEKQTVMANKAIFAKQCEQHHIRHRIHTNDQQWDKHLLVNESRFADLILLSGELFYADINLRQPNSYLQEALHSAECPVLVIPEDFRQCDQLFIAYDGSKESLYAIKQFSYLFPNYSELPSEIVYIRDEASDEIPDLDHLKYYTRLHFSAVGFSKLHFKAAHYFASWISEKKHVLLITGCYSRSPFSYVAKHSFGEQVIHDHRLPVFIAHP
ncbi:MAG TPA: universal stress protein [Puia sp.]|jgi:hypothetical protein|nr:universal stress protein [Puia sp.]